MAKQSAGILVYRRKGPRVEVLLGHPGGPFWAKKDKGAWSVPKGEFEEGEEPLAAAKREFAEEIGQSMPAGELQDLGSFKSSSGKTIYAWAIEGDLDISTIHSNSFEMEWPPKSGQMQQFPELNRAAWVDIAKAPEKMHKGQNVFIERLAEVLQVPLSGLAGSQPDLPQQASLF